MESGIPTVDTKFSRALFRHFTSKELYGKSIKDKRGGKNNIHSWELELKGKVSKDEIDLLNTLLLERRKHCWAEEIGIDWMDGMPLTKKQIKRFYDHKDLDKILADLVDL